MTIPFVHLGLALDVPDDWHNASTMLLSGPATDGPSDAATLRVVPMPADLDAAMSEHAGLGIDGVEVLHDDDVTVPLGAGRRVDCALTLQGNKLVRSTVLIPDDDQLYVVGLMQSRAQYDDGHSDDLDAFLTSLQAAD